MGASRIPLLVLVCVLLLALPGVLQVVFAVDGSWSEWLEWGRCTATCGKGTMQRIRFCSNPAPSHGGASCLGKRYQMANCEGPSDCRIDGGWSEWSMWTSCSVTCGEGVRKRSRDCDTPPPSNDGRDCEGSSEERRTCLSSKDCPRDGKWSKWSSWSPCSVTCGEGSNARYRECNNPPPSPNGRACHGSKQQSRTCKTSQGCSVNGHWSEWSEWNGCSVTCGSGVRMRWRKCDSPPPQNGGEDCSREEAGEMQELSCNGTVVFCPVDGGWSDFGEWGDCLTDDCSKPAEGITFTQRSCNNPYPAHTGSMCQGTFLTAGFCENPINCAVNGQWSEWSEWKCSCNAATRSRKCDNPPPSNGGKKCQGKEVDTYLHGENDEYEEHCSKFPRDECDNENNNEENGDNGEDNEENGDNGEDNEDNGNFPDEDDDGGIIKKDENYEYEDER